MDLQNDWSKIRAHFNTSIRSNLHVAIASIGADNKPTVTPVGSLFLNGDQTGFYCEFFVSQLPKYAKQNPDICILGVNSGLWFWLKSLYNDKFSKHPGIKLYGTLGVRRPATKIEKSRWEKRTRFTKGLKGHDTMWKVKGELFIREITFTSAKRMNLGKMTAHL